MSEAIGPGDQVICVDGTTPAGPRYQSPRLPEGAIYRIAAVTEAPDVGTLFWIDGIRSTHGGFCAWRFRPIRDKGERFMEKLRVGVPVKETVDG